MFNRRLVFCSVVMIAISAYSTSLFASVEVTHVGANPWFANSGGTGNIAGQVPGLATLVKDFTALGDVPIILHSTPSQGIDIFRIDERVRNNTGVGWTDFHFDMERIDANPALSVAFENVTNPTGEFTSIVTGPNAMSLFGFVPAGGIFSLSFDLRVTSQQGSFDLFGIHEYPTVPEPTSCCAWILLGTSTVFGSIWSIRRRSVRNTDD